MKTVNIIACSLIVVLSVSCITRERCQKYFPPQVIITDSVRVMVMETVHDTMILIQQDSSWLRAYIECDSAGQATIKELIDYKSGQHTRIPDVTIRRNVLSSRCICDSIKIHAILKNREIVIDKRSSETITPPAVEVKYIPGWMWFFGISGMIFLGLMLLFGIYKLLKLKNIIKF